MLSIFFLHEIAREFFDSQLSSHHIYELVKVYRSTAILVYLVWKYYTSQVFSRLSRFIDMSVKGAVHNFFKISQ